ncbi:hypothetical protein E6Q11_01815 [Candidatus Dojkabacteria bacterium]|uniref:Uncharacterized protein n=1 Tax=Candidatus Dojkabacteria bacterium TaxID=2099670 RepID=A0A5C7J972_9BACT|nr:MAG: hypothetical protein E6Q11_01815 [Candidatus Dojkabacteria bacterium]
MKAVELIQQAFELVNIYPKFQTLTDYDVTNGHQILNDIFNSWGATASFIPFQTEIKFNMTDGQGKYTVGQGGSYDINSPPIIQCMYGRINYDKVSFPLSIIDEQMFNNIAYRKWKGIPSQLLVRPYIDYTELYFIPEPISSLECILLVKPRFYGVGLYDELDDIPPDYLCHIKYVMVAAIASMYNKQLTPFLAEKSQLAKSSIASQNPTDVSIRTDERLRSSNRFGFRNFYNYW